MSLFDRFFRAPPPDDAEESDPTDLDLAAKIHNWDGKPVIRWTWENVESTYGLAPNWHVTMTGPMLPWVGKRARIDIYYLIMPTREAAIAQAYERAHETAVAENLPWDPEEWHVVSCIPNNAN